MWIVLALLVVTSMISVGLSIVLLRTVAGRPAWEQLGIAALPFVGCTVLWHWIGSIAFKAVAGPWSGARLAPALGLIYGYKLYYPATEGPLSGWIYPPMSALAYLPAVFFGNSGIRISLARALSLLYYYVPAAWLLLGGSGKRRGTPGPGPLLLFSTFVFLTIQSRALLYSSTEVHADAPALGLACLSLAAMVRGGGGRSPRACTIAFALAVLAVWSKQLVLPILVLVLPGYALATGALEKPFRSLLPALAAALAISLTLFVAFDPEDLLFNVLDAPGRHPLRFDTWAKFLSPIGQCYRDNIMIITVVVAGGLARLVAAAPRGGKVPDGAERLGLSEGGWPVFLIAGLAEIPFGLLAYYGVGGDVNSLSYCFYFLSLAGLLMLKPLLGSTGEPRGASPAWVWFVLLSISLVTATLELESLGLVLVNGKPPWRDSVTAERFIRANRDEVYFPWNPQSHLVAEGKYYHFEDGIYDRQVSGYTPTLEHFFRYIPPRTRLVCYPPEADGIAGNAALKYLAPAGFRKTRRANLPGWACFELPGGAPRWSSTRRTTQRSGPWSPRSTELRP